MTGPSDKVTNEPHQKSLPLRDLWLLPVISILTALLMLSASEVIARELWPAAEKDACGNSKGPPGRFLANCKSRVKTPEGPWVDNAYNDCGYRSAQSCGTKKQGTTRIAVLGTSFAYGYLVPYASVYSTLESQSLTRRCGRPVEVQNVTSPGVDMLNVYRRTNEALALRPDLLILVVMSTDVRRDLSKEQLAHRDDPPGSEADQRRPVQGEGFLKRVVVNPIKESRSAYMLQHFMYQDPKTYMRLYLNYGDSGDFYKASSSPATQKHLSDFDVLLREIAQKAQAASVPMLILIGPAAAAVASKTPTLTRNSAPTPSLRK